MPLYQYRCIRCQSFFDILQPISQVGNASCPDCGSSANLIPTAPARVVVSQRERLPYGTGSRGKFIPAEETGGLAVFVPSWGAMEKEEVDYVTEVAVAQERERVAKNQPLNEKNLETKEALGNIVKIGKSQPEGKRAKTMEKVKAGGLR